MQYVVNVSITRMLEKITTSYCTLVKQKLFFSRSHTHIPKCLLLTVRHCYNLFIKINTFQKFWAIHYHTCKIKPFLNFPCTLYGSNRSINTLFLPNVRERFSPSDLITVHVFLHISDYDIDSLASIFSVFSTVVYLIIIIFCSKPNLAI